jgi:hypothetical protein
MEASVSEQTRRDCRGCGCLLSGGRLAVKGGN